MRSLITRTMFLSMLLALIMTSHAYGAEVTGPSTLISAYSNAVVWWGGEPEDCATVELGWEADGILTPNGEFENGHATLPYQKEVSCTLAIAEGEEGCWLEEVMRHEVGHLRGLEHSKDPQSVMYPQGDQSHPLCAVERLNEYEHWLTRERIRCHQVQRRECWASVRTIRRATERRRKIVAATPEMLR